MNETDLERLLQSKAALRRAALACRREISPQERKSRSRRIVARLLEADFIRNVELLHSYVSKADEVDTHELIRTWLDRGRRVAVPRVVPGTGLLSHYLIHDFADLIPGAFGILEPDVNRCAPAPVEEIGLIVVPGCAFDRRGNRIGYGKGFYDRFLAESSAPRVGLAFSCQIFDAVPASDSDIPMDFVVTEEEIIETRRRELA